MGYRLKVTAKPFKSTKNFKKGQNIVYVVSSNENSKAEIAPPARISKSP